MQEIIHIKGLVILNDGRALIIYRYIFYMIYSMNIEDEIGEKLISEPET